MSTEPAAGGEPSRRPVTLHRLRAMHAAREPIAMLTCYDASFARIEDRAGVDVMLVGDSLGQVLQGRESTLAVTVDEMAYHTASVARGNRAAWLIADLPFGGYHASPAEAFGNAAKLMQAGAQMVKLEGAGWAAETIRFLVERGVPVCAHLGFTPQSVHALGGYRVQGRGEDGAVRLAAEANEVAEAGAAMLILEMVPAGIARAVTEALPIPTIGIGAGSSCSGQVLVLHDMLGITQGRMPRFVRDFMAEGGSVEAAIRRYVTAVKDGGFPQDAVHGY